MELRKSEMYFDIIRFMNDKVITLEDMDDFTDELKEDIKELMDRFNVK